MNAPDITFPRSTPELKVKRPRPAGLSPDTELADLPPKERSSLAEALADLQAREENLREYEGHLRAWQSQLDAARHGTLPRHSVHPFVPHPHREDVGLQAGWEKVHRARELLEAEQKHLVEDRLLLQEREEALKKREAALALREQRLAAREQTPTAAVKPKAKKATSTMETLTRAPFAMAKSVFGAKA